VYFDIDQIKFAENSVDVRMKKEMALGHR